MISGYVELQHPPAPGAVLPELLINELVVDQLIDRDQLGTTAMLKDIVMPSVEAARELFTRCESKGLFTDEWNA